MDHIAQTKFYDTADYLDSEEAIVAYLKQYDIKLNRHCEERSDAAIQSGAI